jgi:hypothetical protein
MSAIQWMGLLRLKMSFCLDYCMPNRIQTGTRVYTKDDVSKPDETAHALRGAV